jgi:uncharacterized protein (TIGR00369 family)
MSDEALSTVNDGFLKLLGAQVVAADPDRVELRMTVTEDHLQPAGLIHGGVHCTLVETAASIGAYLWYSREHTGTVVGVTNSTDFIRGAGAGATLTAIATPIHRGRTQQLWLVEITGADGKLVSRGQVRLQNLPAR